MEEDVTDCTGAEPVLVGTEEKEERKGRTAGAEKNSAGGLPSICVGIFC